jgi:glycerophosphoryl diester phosphodiesterase
VPVPFADGHAIEIIAHRGASKERPEQTRSAYALALEQGADGLECDVRLTLDQIPVCVHDASMTRMAGIDRNVSQLTLAQLRALDLAHGGPAGSSDVPRAERGILTLEEFCELAVDAGRPVTLAVELKHPSRFGGLVERASVAVLDRFGLRGRDSRGVETETAKRVTVRLMSFSQTALERLAKTAPDLDRVFLTDSGPLSWPWGRHLPGGAGIAGPSVRMLRMQPELIQSWQQMGRKVHCWTANAADDVTACVQARVDAIITDVPGQTLEIVRSAAGSAGH